MTTGGLGRLAAVCSAALASVGCASGEPAPEAEPVAFLAPGMAPEDLRRRVERFAPTVIDFDDSSLTPRERATLALLVDASRVMDELFLIQVSPRNPEWRSRLERESGEGRDEALAYFDIMFGPWDRVRRGEPFLDVGPRPPGAGYYPEDLGTDEFEAWISERPERAATFRSYFTVIRRAGDSLVAVPYSEAYAEALERAAGILRRAAELAENPSLRRFLRSRADAFASNDYFESDMAWMDIQDSAIEPTIGPYEVYEDQLLGYKAAFEAFITVADPAAGAQLERLKGWLPELEAALPVDDRHRSPGRAFESPIRVVDVAFTAGDTKAGFQTVAFNLPNDDRVRSAKGSKMVMLRNVSRAKFETILRAIADTVLPAEMAREVGFEPWFTKVLMHELAHGLGPGAITLASGERTTVNQALRDRHSVIEEAKADVVGLHALTVLAQEGVYGTDFVRQAFLSHVADLFRAVRFGTTSAHGRANLVEFNWLWEREAIRYDAESGRFQVDLDAVMGANRQLATELLTLQGEGSYERAGRVLERYGSEMSPHMQATLSALADVPVDIRPRYAVLERMDAWRAPVPAPPG